MSCNNGSHLVLEINQGCPRGYSFTINQKHSSIDEEGNEIQVLTPLDITGYTVQFRVKEAPYYKLKDLIAKDITEVEDATKGVITNPTEGKFTVQITLEDTLKLPPNDYALCIYLKDEDTFTNISGDGNRFAIFRVCTQ